MIQYYTNLIISLLIRIIFNNIINSEYNIEQFIQLKKYSKYKIEQYI
jgi:hypothetical protein